VALALDSHREHWVVGSFGGGEDNRRHVQDIVRGTERHTCTPGLAAHNVCFVVSCPTQTALGEFVGLLSLGDIFGRIQREGYPQQDSTWGCSCLGGSHFLRAKPCLFR
jgi:hypothetical protein